MSEVSQLGLNGLLLLPFDGQKPAHLVPLLERLRARGAVPAFRASKIHSKKCVTPHGGSDPPIQLWVSRYLEPCFCCMSKRLPIWGLVVGGDQEESACSV